MNQMDFYYIITINIQTERKKEMWNQRGNYRKIIEKQKKKENTEEFRTEGRPVSMILS